MNNQTKIIALLYAFTLAGCSNTNGIFSPNIDKLDATNDWVENVPDEDDQILEKINFTEFNGDNYKVNESGEIVLTKTELKQLQDKGAKEFYPSSEGIEINGQVLNILMQDKDAFFTYTKNPNLNNNHESVFVVTKGSLKENIIRLSEQKGVNSIRWDLDYDFYIPSNKIITAKNYSVILSLMLKHFNVAFKYTDGDTSFSAIRFYERNKSNQAFSFTIEQGSFQDNFIRLSKAANWGRKWEIDHDFYISSTQTIYGKNYHDILNKILVDNNFPIESEVL